MTPSAEVPRRTGVLALSLRVALCCLLLLAAGARAGSCPVPDEAEPYRTVASASERDKRLLLDEYMYVHAWATYADARSAGFQAGDRVYGEVIDAGDGVFTPRAVAQWRKAYERSSRKAFKSGLGKVVDVSALDVRVVGWLLNVCLGPGLWSGVSKEDGCQFRFSAGIQNAPARGAVRGTVLDVQGARCDRWPNTALTPKGTSVTCVRTDAGAVRIALQTDRAGRTQQELQALPAPASVPEPVMESIPSRAVQEIVQLTRSQDYRLVALGVGCPTCRLYAADVQASTPAGLITEVSTIASSGSGWRRCPADLRCRLFEFSPVDRPEVVGCTGVKSCRVWRLAEADAEATDVIQLTVETPPAQVCANCPPGTTYEEAHAAWDKARSAVTQCSAQGGAGGRN